MVHEIGKVVTLSAEEREEVNDLVESWNTQGLPEKEKKK